MNKKINELVDQLYCDFDQIKRIVKEKDKHLYDRWAAGGFLIETNLVSMYPNIQEVLEILESSNEGDEDEEDDND